MPIQPTDITFRLSGGASNSSAAASLGGAKSSAAVSGSAAVVFDGVTSAESTAGDVEYRCIYPTNGNASLTLENAVVWLSANTASGDTTIAIGVGTSAVNGTEQAVANESTAPAGVTFTAAGSSGAALALGNLPPGQHRAIWLRRTVNAGAGSSSDTAEIRVDGGFTE